MPSIQSCKLRPQVDDNEWLWRRLYMNKEIPQIVPDGKGGYRPASAAFWHPQGRLSVNIASKTTPQKSIAGPPKGDALTGFQAHIPKGFGCTVEEDPLPANPAHAEVCGQMDKKQRKFLAEKCVWIIPPEKPHTTST